MYFEILKKVGTAETRYVNDPRSNELTIVRPWQDWFEHNGHMVNWFVWTRLSNHDLYVYIDREFLTFYRDRDLSKLLVNIVNDEIYRFMGSKMKEPWKHQYNMLDIIEDLQTDLRHISAAKCKQICQYLLDLRARSLKEKRYSVFHKQIELMAKYQLGFAELSDTPNTFVIYQQKYRVQLKFSVEYYTKKIFVKDEEIIKDLERIVEIVEKNEEIHEQRVELMKQHEGEKNFSAEKELPLVKMSDEDKAKIRGIVWNNDPKHREFRREKTKERVVLNVPEKLSSKVVSSTEDSLEKKINTLLTEPVKFGGGPYNKY